MKQKFCTTLLALCLLLTACAPAAQPEMDTGPAPEASAPEETPPESPSVPEEPPEPELSQREQDWREDIEYLREQYKEQHLHPFYCRSEEEFDWELDRLAEKVNDLTDNDIYFELAATVASMGDIHTSVQPPDSIYEQLFPLVTYYWGDRLYLGGYLEGYDEFAPYLFHEIVAVNGVDIAYLRKKAESITSPNNSWFSKEKSQYLWNYVPAFFDWAGCEPQEGYSLQILNDNREVKSVEIPVVSRKEFEETDWIPHIGEGNGDRVQYIKEKSGECVYLMIGPVRTLDEAHYRGLMEETAELLKVYPDCGKLAIDLRGNPGGYSTSVTYLRNNLHILQELPFEQVFVLTNGYTTSGGIACLTLFKDGLGAISVGEPTGQFTSFFMHGSSMTGVSVTLPHSQLSVVVATGWHEGDNPESTVYNKDRRLYEWENTILPDVYVYQDIEDIRQGKDSVLEWVLAQ